VHIVATETCLATTVTYSRKLFITLAVGCRSKETVQRQRAKVDIDVDRNSSQNVETKRRRTDDSAATFRRRRG